MTTKHTSKQDKEIFMTDDGIQLALADMVQDELMLTKPDKMIESDGTSRPISFTEKHTLYLKSHPKMNPQNYLANVKTMIRIRQK
jgi:uncharacterized metal-binding protein YceD (DUF177 family)